MDQNQTKQTNVKCTENTSSKNDILSKPSNEAHEKFNSITTGTKIQKINIDELYDMYHDMFSGIFDD